MLTHRQRVVVPVPGVHSNQAVSQVLVVDVMHRREVSDHQILEQLIRSSIDEISHALRIAGPTITRNEHVGGRRSGSVDTIRRVNDSSDG